MARQERLWWPGRNRGVAYIVLANTRCGVRIPSPTLQFTSKVGKRSWNLQIGYLSPYPRRTLGKGWGRCVQVKACVCADMSALRRVRSAPNIDYHCDDPAIGIAAGQFTEKTHPAKSTCDRGLLRSCGGMQLWRNPRTLALSPPLNAASPVFLWFWWLMLASALQASLKLLSSDSSMVARTHGNAPDASDSTDARSH